MAKWTRKKIDSNNINNGNEYSANDVVSLEELNGMVNSGLYAQDFAEKLTETPDTSEAGNVGTPSVSFVDAEGSTTDKPYKKFKFSNLKGESGKDGKSAGFGTPTATVDSNVGTPSVTVTATGSNEAKVFNFEFHNLKGEKGEDGEGAITLAQETGQSTTEGMSQKAITDELEKRSLKEFTYTFNDGSTSANAINLESALGLSLASKYTDSGGNIEENTKIIQLSEGIEIAASKGNTEMAYIYVQTAKEDPESSNPTKIGVINLSVLGSNGKTYGMGIGGVEGIGFILDDKIVYIPKKNGTLEISQVQETLVIPDTSWQALSDSDPFTYSATATATTTINTDSEVELINNQAVLFAKYGFSIAQVSEQTITFYVIDKPTSAVNLLIGVRG